MEAHRMGMVEWRHIERWQNEATHDGDGKIEATKRWQNGATQN